MENQFLIDSEYLSAEALEKKHRLETDPSSRKSHMEYMPGMEQITSDVMEKVMSQMNSYDYEKYKKICKVYCIQKRAARKSLMSLYTRGGFFMLFFNNCHYLCI